MSVSAMKCALQSLESVEKVNGWNKDSIIGRHCTQSAHFLRQAIAEAEKIVPSDYPNSHQQEPVAVKHMMDWVYQLKRLSNDGRYMNIPSGLSAGACYELAVEIEQFIKTAPVHASENTEKQEPVVGTKTWFEDGKMVTQHLYASDISQERVDETEKGKHEPVAWFIQYEYRHEFLWREPTAYEKNSALEVKPLYTAPQKREWVGLTDEEKEAATGWSVEHIEAKLKEKNT